MSDATRQYWTVYPDGRREPCPPPQPRPTAPPPPPREKDRRSIRERRAAVTLDVQVCAGRYGFVTRREWMERAAADGATIVGERLILPDGSFWTMRDTTATALDYFRSLTRSPNPDTLKP